MKIVIDEKKLKKKNRKKPWTWYCKNCRKKLILDTGDIYYEIQGAHSEGVIFQPVCSYECAEQKIKGIAESLFLIKKYSELGVYSYSVHSIDREEFDEWFELLDKPEGNLEKLINAK